MNEIAPIAANTNFLLTKKPRYLLKNRQNTFVHIYVVTYVDQGTVKKNFKKCWTHRFILG